MNFSDQHIPQDQDNGKTMGPGHQQPSPTGKRTKHRINISMKGRGKCQIRSPKTKTVKDV